MKKIYCNNCDRKSLISNEILWQEISTQLKWVVFFFFNPYVNLKTYNNKRFHHFTEVGSEQVKKPSTPLIKSSGKS